MTIINWIFLGLTAVSLALYIISLCKNNDILNKVSSVSLITFTGALNTTFLINKLPDTFNTLIITIITYVLLIGIEVLNIINKNKIMNIIKLSLFFINTICWASLYNSVFYIYRISSLFITLMIICYLAIIVFTCIKIGKQKRYFYCYSFLELFVCFFLNFYSVVSLVYGRNLNSLVLFLGTSTNIVLALFYIFNLTKKSYKHEKLIKYLLLLAAQLLISYSNVILFY